MRNTPTRVALGVAAIIATIQAVRSIRVWVDDTLSQIDEALCRIGDSFDLDDDEDEKPAQHCDVCGGAGHRSNTIALLETPAWLDNAEHGVLAMTAKFQFDQSDPLAIEMTLVVQVYRGDEFLGQDQQCWGFARDILDTALSTSDQRMIGDGDVRAQYAPERDELWVWLYDSKGAEHRITMPAGPVRQFMANTFRIVPAGTEAYDDAALDSEILSVFREGE